MIIATESIRDRRRLIQFESGGRLVRPESKRLRSRRESIDPCLAWALGTHGPTDAPEMYSRGSMLFCTAVRLGS
jgi:hypothetical protein